jgi:hypothetical protein
LQRAPPKSKTAIAKSNQKPKPESKAKPKKICRQYLPENKIENHFDSNLNFSVVILAEPNLKSSRQFGGSYSLR